MDSGRWGRVEDLFHEAADLGPTERSAFLDRVCREDGELRREVESLLAADTPQDELVQAVVCQAVDQLPTVADEISEPIGTRIGCYLITGLIGKGGMGVVYRAVRERDFRMQVAIKLLKRGTDTEIALSRFRSERQILASLQHPNIAHLLDGGATDTGLPYFVMEYVDGTPLLEYAAPLSVRQRIELFRSICLAVQYAHQHRIIHRDIKPANILVARDGTPKLLDFGIAKLVDPTAESTNGATLTMAGVRLMTPDYASPEQVRGEPITTATDIYQLGAVLYELLTGRRAHQITTCSPAEIEREICIHEPTKPSAVVKHLDPDLDNVVLKALRKEPERRYASAQELVDDLERFLHDLPVQARPESLIYRGRKFLKRKQQMIAAATVPIVLLLAFVGGREWFASHPRAMVGSIVLADFVNKTGDAVFDGSLQEALSLKLAESPSIRILPDQQITRTLRMMGHKARDPVLQPVALEICVRNGLQAVVSGSISQLGNHYLLRLDAMSCASGDYVARTGTEVTGKERVLAALGKAAVDLRRKLGESLGSLQKFDKPFEATSSSLEALQAFTMARKARQEGRLKDDCALLLRAIQLDPNFAYAYAALSAEYSNLRQTGKAAEYGRKAFELRDRVTEREKFILLDRYYGTVTGQLEERIESDKLWTLTYPRDFIAFVNLGTAYGRAGENEKSLAASLQALQLDPHGSPVSYINAMGAYAALGRFDEAKRIYEKAKQLKIFHRHLPVYYYDLAFLRHDHAGMEEAVRVAMNMEGGEYDISVEQALAEAYFGHLRQSRQLFQSAVESAQRDNDNARVAFAYATLGHLEALFGSTHTACQDANHALRLSSERDILALAGCTLALSGQCERASALKQELERKFPLNTIVNRVYMPALSAEIQMAQKKPTQAIEALKLALPYELASISGTLVMYATYARGEAYLRERKGAAAAAEFQKIVDHPGTVMNSPVGALAFLGLARAYAMTKDGPHSRIAYQKFLTLWNEADSDLPILVQARQQYSALSKGDH